jgi:hypothetical protein
MHTVVVLGPEISRKLGPAPLCYCRGILASRLMERFSPMINVDILEESRLRLTPGHKIK